jgi:hypothetical protein
MRLETLVEHLWREKKCKVLVINPKEKSLQRYVYTYVENMEMGPKEVECEGLDWLYLRYERD